jgi:superfamily II DNA or RNA helicase
MFTLIKKNDLSAYLSKYPILDTPEFLLYELNGFYILPRNFYTNYPSDLLVNYVDEHFKPQTADISFNSELRPYQISPLKKLESMYFDRGNELHGIFQAIPGFGKTVSVAYLSSKFKQKTLIIIDNTKLLEQWVDAYTKFTNITDIGIIQGSRFDFEKPVAIAMVQTLLSKIKNNISEFYEVMRSAGYNFIVYDEVHATSSAPMFSKSTILFNSKNILGLTATPYVRDVNKILLDNTIGNVLLEVKNYDLTPKIIFCKYDSGLSKKYNYKLQYAADFVRKLAMFNSIIYDNPTYLELISKVVKEAISKNHRVLILASTIKQVQTITANLINKGISAKAFYSEQKEVDKINDMVLVATMKMCSKGFDYKQLSALVLASPLQGKISLIQSIGRILRESDNKTAPIVYDLIESGFNNLFINTISQKKKIFKEEFNITEFEEY